MSLNSAWGGFRTYLDRNVAEVRRRIIVSNLEGLDPDAIVHLCRTMPPKGKD